MIGPARTRYLRPDRLHLWRTERGELGARIGDTTYPSVSLSRAFPLSDPDCFIVMHTGGGREVGAIREIGTLPGELQRLTHEELARHHFVPAIDRILSLKIVHPNAAWHVDTDAGERRFTVPIGRDGVQQLAGGDLLIIDVYGNRYRLSAYGSLPRKWRRAIKMVL